IQRLPAIYRSAFLLCCVEGMSHAKASRRLEIAESSVSSRVARARQRLHQRLTQRGVELSAVLAAATIASTSKALPSADTTTRLALAYASGRAGAAGLRAGGLSAPVVSLAEGVSGTMGTTHLKFAALALLMLGLCAGVLFVNDRIAVAREQLAPPSERATQSPAPEKVPVDAQPAFTYRGRVLGADGKAAAGAKVYLDYPTGNERSVKQRTITDKDGRFEFRVKRAEFDTAFYAEPWKLASVAAVAPGHGPVWASAGSPANAANLTLWL